MTPPRLILVTDPAFGDDAIVRCVREVARALPRGALSVQLRDKRRGDPSLRIFAGGLRAVTCALGSALVLNGRPGLARDVGADGVHLGAGAGTVEGVRSVFPGAWISMAAHSDDDVRRACAEGADAVLVSPVFPSRPPGVGGVLKEGRGVEALRRARSLAGGAQVFALGGVNRHNAGACAAAGAHGVALMKAVLASPSPGRAARAIHDAVARGW